MTIRKPTLLTIFFTSLATICLSGQVAFSADSPGVTGATTDEDIQTSSGLVITANGAGTTHFKIVDITNGTLYKNNGTTQIIVDEFITEAEGNEGLKFTPTANFNGIGSIEVAASEDDIGTGLSSTVPATITVDPVNDPPNNTAIPTISGTFNVGNVLTASTGTWNDSTDITPGTLTYTYQWRRANDGSGAGEADISGATNSTYTLVPPDKNKYIRVKVTATDDGEGTPATASTSAYSTYGHISNKAPVITESDPQTVTMSEDGSPTAFILTLNATDADEDTITWSISDAADHGTAEASGTGESKSISYTPDEDYNGSDSFIVQVSDSTDTDTITVNVTIEAVNDAPTANAGTNQLVDEGTPVTLNGSNSSDPDTDDGDSITYLWEQDPTDDFLVTLSSETAASPTFTSPDVGTSGASLHFTLTVEDEEGETDSDTCIVNISFVNLPPNADAGTYEPILEGAGTIITLNGSNSSDPDDGDKIVSYLWEQDPDDDFQVTLSSATADSPTFTSPDVGTEGTALHFTLTVEDMDKLQDRDTCIVNVTFDNLPPNADAGSDQTVQEGTLVTLNGANSSDPDDGDRIVSHLWTQISGPSVTLSAPTATSPTFTSPDVGTGGASLVFQLTVTDTGGLQDTDTCTVTVTFDNLPPDADAGSDQLIRVQGITVTLNGLNSSDPDEGDSVVTYLWAQITGPSVTLSDANAASPTFISPNVGTGGESLSFQLTVTDTGGLTDTDTCIVNVHWDNDPPVANAGPDQSVEGGGTTVTLNGSGSTDPDDGIEFYLWAQTEGGFPATLSDATAVSPTFVIPAFGTNSTSLTFELTVEDTNGLKSTDACIVNVTWINKPPIADAGPNQTVYEGTIITLDGSNSYDPDPLDGIASYLWIQTGGPLVSLSDANAIKPNFLSPGVGPNGSSLTFQLAVIDKGGLQDIDTCIVNVTLDNAPPVANAGNDQTVEEGVTVTLDGSNSTDPDDGIKSYLWSQTDGTPVILSNPDESQPTFTAPSVGSDGESLTFQLTIFDNGGLQSTDTCIINVDGNSNDGNDGGGGGGGGGIFGVISINDVIGYHLDGTAKNGTKIYMPVTNGYKALKGAQTHIEKIAPALAKLIRGGFESLEQKAEANKEGLLYRIGTYAYPILGKIAELYLDVVGSEVLMTNAYSDTTISVTEFDKLHQQGIAISPHIVKNMDKE